MELTFFQTNKNLGPYLSLKKKKKSSCPDLTTGENSGWFRQFP
jgi:hypothetical protein